MRTQDTQIMTPDTYDEMQACLEGDTPDELCLYEGIGTIDDDSKDIFLQYALGQEPDDVLEYPQSWLDKPAYDPNTHTWDNEGDSLRDMFPDELRFDEDGWHPDFPVGREISFGEPLAEYFQLFEDHISYQLMTPVIICLLPQDSVSCPDRVMFISYDIMEKRIHLA